MRRAACAFAVSLGTLALCSADPPLKKAVPAKPAYPRTTSVPAITQEQQTAQQLYAMAVKDFSDGNLESARTGFQKVLAIAPENPPALINLALIAQRQKHDDEAEKFLRRVIQKDTENATAWLLLGIGAYERNDLDAAHAHLAQAVLHAPQDARAHQYLGSTFARRGWFSAGEDELRRALEIDPKSADVHFNLAAIYMERIPPATDLARRHYQRALELGAQPDEKLAERIGK
ncbi:MAG: tetratricopeptide repeat protein [Chthoniobacteraceae bacterium]